MNNICALGEKFKIIRDNIELKETNGLIHYPRTRKEFISFAPDADVKSGDTVIRVITGQEYKIIKVEPHVAFGQIDQLLTYHS